MALIHKEHWSKPEAYVFYGIVDFQLMIKNMNELNLNVPHARMKNNDCSNLKLELAFQCFGINVIITKGGVMRDCFSFIKNISSPM